MIIDGHAHACGSYVDPEEIQRTLTENGLDAVLLTAGELGSRKTYGFKDVTAQKPRRDVVNDNNLLIGLLVKLFGLARQIQAGNELVFELKKLDPRVRQKYWITHEGIDQLALLHDRMHFDCAKLHQCWVKKSIGSQDFSDLLGFLTRIEVPLFIHLASAAEVDPLIEACRRYPGVPVIVAHCVGLERFIARKDEVPPNLLFDISNAYFVSADRIRDAAAAFGSSRVVFGSDTPYGVDAVRLTLQRVRGLGLGEEEVERILGNNLARILKISPSQPGEGPRDHSPGRDNHGQM